jgi:hypothetical protein
VGRKESDFLNFIFTKFGIWPEKLVKVKAIPLQAWTGNEVSRSLRLPDFKIIGT